MSSDDSTKLALEHSRQLFIYHAGQRIQSLNFYFVAIAVFLTGFGFLATANLGSGERAIFGTMLALAGFWLTQFIQGLDKRNECLVHCDEDLLKYAEAIMANPAPPACPVPEWEVTKRAGEDNKAKHYTKMVPYIFALYKALSVIGGIYFACPWIVAALRR
jgi:hypothetical protein